MKIFNFIAVLFLTSLLFASCEKTSVVNEVKTNPTPMYSVNGPQNKIVFDTKLTPNGMGTITDIYCKDVPANCYDDVVIEVSNQAPYDEFVNALNNGELNEYFNTSDYELIFPGMGLEVMTQIQSGDLVIHSYQNVVEDNLVYYIVLPSTIVFNPENDSWLGDVVSVFVIDIS